MKLLSHVYMHAHIQASALFQGVYFNYNIIGFDKLAGHNPWAYLSGVFSWHFPFPFDYHMASGNCFIEAKIICDQARKN